MEPGDVYKRQQIKIYLIVFQRENTLNNNQLQFGPINKTERITT
jgi:hypothetical protein